MGVRIFGCSPTINDDSHISERVSAATQEIMGGPFAKTICRVEATVGALGQEVG